MKTLIEEWRGSQVKAKKSSYKHINYQLFTQEMRAKLDSNLNTSRRKGTKRLMEAHEQRQLQVSPPETTTTSVILSTQSQEYHQVEHTRQQVVTSWCR